MLYFQIKKVANKTPLFPRESKSQQPRFSRIEWLIYLLPENKMAATLQSPVCIFNGTEAYSGLRHTLDSSFGHLALKKQEWSVISLAL